MNVEIRAEFFSVESNLRFQFSQCLTFRFSNPALSKNTSRSFSFFVVKMFRKTASKVCHEMM